VTNLFSAQSHGFRTFSACIFPKYFTEKYSTLKEQIYQFPEDVLSVMLFGVFSLGHFLPLHAVENNGGGGGG
jgi:hypothetical protein